MSIYYRNSQKQVAEFVECREIWINVFAPHSEFQDIGGKPYGFDVGTPGEIVKRKEVAVAGINENHETDVFVAVVFVTEAEDQEGLTKDMASAQALEAGYVQELVIFDDSEKTNLVYGAIKLLDASEAQPAESVCADLVRLNREDPFADERLKSICSDATKAILKPDPLKGPGLDVVIAALRWFQSCTNGDHDMSEITDIADPDDITPVFIDDLCSALNVGREEGLESFSSLVISTGHMTFADNGKLAKMATESSSRVSDIFYGYRVRLNEKTYHSDFSDRGLSNAIRRVFDFAVANGFGAIEFDRDADFVPGLEVFEW